MAPAKNCKKCALPVDINKPFTVCEGRCAQSFHGECANLTESELCVLSTNIIWMCDGCLKEFFRYREKSFVDATTNTSLYTSVEDEIKELKSTVADIVDALAKVVPRTKPIAPLSSTPVTPVPVSSLELFDGTDEMLDSEQERTQVSPHTEDRRNFALYLTRIDKWSTELDIHRMVCRSLAAPSSVCKEVVKLVPKWKDISMLDYVSFKIVLDGKCKSLAMQQSTWPKGIKFREFVNQLNETWKPN